MFYTFLAISLLFIIALAVKARLGKNLCSLCFAIASVWLGLLFLYKTNQFSDPIIIGLLIGQSITGIFYLALRKLPKSLRIFSLPFFLTLTAAGYFLITSNFQIPVLFMLGTLWLLAWIIFSYSRDPGKAAIAKIAANCCEDL